MSKVICDVCGTTYPETSVSCPICGCAKNTTVQTGADSSLQADPEAGYAYVKGGRFSKSNVRKRNQKPRDTQPRGSSQKPEQDKTNAGLIAVVIILLLAIAAVLIYIGIKWFVPSGNPNPGSSSSSSSSSVVEPLSVPCTGLVMDDTSITLPAEGSAWLLNVKTEPADTTDKITFSSSNDQVATVSASGNIKAVGGGEAVITITCGEITKECKVICAFGDPVVPGTETSKPNDDVPAGFVLKLNRDDFTLSKQGETWKLFNDTADVKASDITWTVDDPTIAAVDENGRVSAVGKGFTTVRATIGDQKASCVVRVGFTPEAPEDVKHIINKKDVTIKVGESFSLFIQDSETKANVPVEWQADAEGYVSIDGKQIAGVKSTADLEKGYVVVSATVEEQTYSCIIRVREAEKKDET